MNTSVDKTGDMPPKDPVDILIYEKGLRITTVLPIKELDLMVIVLNNRRVIKSPISCFKLLKGASQEQLDKWQLKRDGAALRWEELDEDLSLRGFITNNLMGGVLHKLEAPDIVETEII